MDVLCTDKTGTITQNRLAVAQIFPVGNRSSEEVLRMAALASDAATQDPIDLAVLEAAQEKEALNAIPHRIQFVPFDPATKRSEAIYEQPTGKLRVIKGAPDALTSLPLFATQEALQTKSNGSQGEAREFSPWLPEQSTRWSLQACLGWKTPFGKTPKRWCRISRAWACASLW